MSILETMQVALVRRPGGPSFEVTTVPTPEPGPGQILVRVRACGVNFSDVKRRRGDVYPFPTTFPYVPGGEIAGEVVARGPGVDAPAIGTKVFALAGADGSGGYAQYALAYARGAVPIPDGLTMEAASTLLIAGTTAKLVVDDVARVKPGETVFVSAGAGGVGSFAVQLARHADARTVIAGVGHASKRRQALDLGAHAAVVTTSRTWQDEVRELTGGRGIDIALESIGGDAVDATLQCLAPFGRMVVYGSASGLSSPHSAAVLDRLVYAPAPNQSLCAFNLGGWFAERPAAAVAALTQLVTMVMSGQVRIPPIATFTLGEVRTAHERLEGRETSGKLVVTPWA